MGNKSPSSVPLIPAEWLARLSKRAYEFCRLRGKKEERNTKRHSLPHLLSLVPPTLHLRDPHRNYPLWLWRVTSGAKDGVTVRTKECAKIRTGRVRVAAGPYARVIALARTHARTHACTSPDESVLTHARVHTYAQAHVYTHVYTYTYIYATMHMHTAHLEYTNAKRGYYIFRVVLILFPMVERP